MKTKCSITIITILCLMCSSLWAESYWNLALEDNSQNSDDQEQSEQSYLTSEYYDDLRMCYLMAIFPGFLVHGLGNMQAGNGRRGAVLLAVEIGSLVGFVLCALAGINDGGSSKGMGVLSFMLFFGSWIFDIATVGGAVKAKYKKKGVQISILQPMPGYSQYKDGISLISLSVNF